MNINSKEYWDSVYKKEAERDNIWRKYPETIKQITTSVKGMKRILELGSGQGLLSEQLIKESHSVVAIDISKEASKQYAQRTGRRSLVAELPPIPLNEKFDCIVATEFLEHITNVNEMLKDCTRISNSVVMVVPNDVLGPEECSEHVQQFNQSSLFVLFSKYYDDVEVDEYVDTFDKIKLKCLIVKGVNFK